MDDVADYDFYPQDTPINNNKRGSSLTVGLSKDNENSILTNRDDMVPTKLESYNDTSHNMSNN